MTRRTDRVEVEIRTQVAQLLAREIKDPRVGFVTVTRVTVTPDLSFARIYVGVLGDQAQRDAVMEVLRGAQGFVRKSLGRRLRMRRTPDVVFEYDKGLDASERVNTLLAENPPRPVIDGEEE